MDIEEEMKFDMNKSDEKENYKQTLRQMHKFKNPLDLEEDLASINSMEPKKG
jgi:hypothetical protein